MEHQFDSESSFDDDNSAFKRILMFSINLVNILETIVENSRVEFVEKKQIKLNSQHDLVSNTYDSSSRKIPNPMQNMDQIPSHKKNTISSLNGHFYKSKISIERKLSQDRIRKHLLAKQNHTGLVNQDSNTNSRNDQISIKVYTSSNSKRRHMRHSSINGSHLSNSPSSFYGSTGTRSPDSVK